MALSYYRPCFDFSKSANADNVINIHESSSLLILSAFYIVLSRIHSMIIILSVLGLCDYDDMYRMDEIKSLSIHIMFYRLLRGVAKYIVSGNTFSSFGWLQSLYAAHHGAWWRDRSRWRTTSQDTRSSFLNEGLHL